MFRSARLSLRFLVPLFIAMLALAYAVVPLVDTLTLRWFVRDMEIRAALIGSTIGEPLRERIAVADWERVDVLLERATADERLYALGICGPDGKLLRKSRMLPLAVDCQLAAGMVAGSGLVLDLPQGPLHAASVPLPFDEVAGSLLVVHDMSFVSRRSADTRNYVIVLFTILGLALGMITVLVAHLSWRGWVQGVRAMLRGEGVIMPFAQPRPELQPLVGDLRAMLRDMQAEQRFEDDATRQWTPETLRRLLHEQLSGDEVLVVSNREPYIHVRGANGITMQRPASGLVTAVEPVMRACSGTWIAHGSGSADRDVVDAADRVRVPSTEGSYTLRRLWLSKEEENGYYYGFANEGLWPLCHIAHVRPVFRSADWAQYRAVNQRFADAVVAEARTRDPVVLVQDYHLALLPQMIRERLPKATIITFWHIPWPNPESFGICPWREEIIQGLLGSTIIGFHTRYHCSNFLQTVDRFLEARIEHESSTVHVAGHLTQVESYPISIAWPQDELAVLPAATGAADPSTADPSTADPLTADPRGVVRRRFGLAQDHCIALGVDRLDYTKGIVERIRAVEHLFERRPEWIGRLTFVQIAAPTRSSLDEYQRFESQVRATATQVNARFGNASYQPIRLLVEHHDTPALTEYFRACDVCLVTSLHDGMNLVAKEFVAAREDERGVLVLSQFAGASRELHESLIVNPYHAEEVADALHRALAMPLAEQRERMRALRRTVREFNVYRWAARMLLDAARLRRRERIGARLDTPV